MSDVTTLPPCPVCGDEPTIGDHEVKCLECGILVEGGCQEEAEATWYEMTRTNEVETLRARHAALREAARAYVAAREPAVASMEGLVKGTPVGGSSTPSSNNAEAVHAARARLLAELEEG